MDWLAKSLGKRPVDPIEVASLPAILADIKKQGTKYGSAIVYYEASGLIYTKEIHTFKKVNILIELVPVDEQEHVAIFIISSGSRKIIYAPCDVKPFPKWEKFQAADALIIGNTIIGDILKNGFQLNEDNPLRKELFTLDEIDTIRKQYGIKRVIITHLEEDWGKSYNDYRELERELSLIHFAYDG